MKPLGTKEKNDLFFKYLVLFTLTSGAFLFALFFTQEARNDMVNENEKPTYAEFASFEKNKPDIMKLLDTVTTTADEILKQNASGSLATQKANRLIDEFVSSKNINLSSPSFLNNIIELLKTYVNTTAEKKGNEDQQMTLKKKLEECSQALEKKDMFDAIKQSVAQPPAN